MLCNRIVKKRLCTTVMVGIHIYWYLSSWSYQSTSSWWSNKYYWYALQCKSCTRFKDVWGFPKKSWKTRRSIKSEILYQILFNQIICISKSREKSISFACISVNSIPITHPKVIRGKVDIVFKMLPISRGGAGCNLSSNEILGDFSVLDPILPRLWALTSRLRLDRSGLPLLLLLKSILFRQFWKVDKDGIIS